MTATKFLNGKQPIEAYFTDGWERKITTELRRPTLTSGTRAATSPAIASHSSALLGQIDPRPSIAIASERTFSMRSSTCSRSSKPAQRRRPRVPSGRVSRVGGCSALANSECSLPARRNVQHEPRLSVHRCTQPHSRLAKDQVAPPQSHGAQRTRSSP